MPDWLIGTLVIVAVSAWALRLDDHLVKWWRSRKW